MIRSNLQFFLWMFLNFICNLELIMYVLFAGRSCMVHIFFNYTVNMCLESMKCLVSYFLLTNIEIRKLQWWTLVGIFCFLALPTRGNCWTEECVKGDNRAGGTVPKWKGDGWGMILCQGRDGVVVSPDLWSEPMQASPSYLWVELQIPPLLSIHVIFFAIKVCFL